MREFVTDLLGIEAGTRTEFRPGLRIKSVNKRPGVMEMTWAGDGRATFQWGNGVVQGKRHVIWRRCGSHAILKNP